MRAIITMKFLPVAEDFRISAIPIFTQGKSMRFCWLLMGLMMGFGAWAVESAHPAVPKIYVAYPEVSDVNDPVYYYQQVLRLVLEKTQSTDGDFELHYSKDYYSFDRATHMLMKGDRADVMWASVTPEREALMQLIPHDLLRSLNNYRVLVIRPGDQQKFSRIASFEEFKQLTSGGGDRWTSTKILQMNGIKVSTAPYYGSIIKMLAAGRFDYISRGLHEASGDLILGQHFASHVSIESSLLLQYQTPISYSFFVNKTNLELADRLNRGLALAERDGSLVAVFDSMKIFREASEFMKQNRRIFVLKNTP